MLGKAIFQDIYVPFQKIDRIMGNSWDGKSNSFANQIFKGLTDRKTNHCSN